MFHLVPEYPLTRYVPGTIYLQTGSRLCGEPSSFTAPVAGWTGPVTIITP